MIAQLNNPSNVRAAKRALHPEPVLRRLAETFAVLSDPSRIQLVTALAGRELCVGDLAALVGLTESAVSHQLRLMRNLRLVRSRREGKLVFYGLDDNHIESLIEQALEHVQEQQ